MASITSLAHLISSVKDSTVIRVSCEKENDNHIIYIDAEPKENKICPHCGCRCPGYDHHSKRPRLWRDLDWGPARVFIRYRPWRVSCPSHGVVTEAVPWAHRDDDYTKAFRVKMVQETLASTNLAAAQSLGVDTETIESNIWRTLERLGRANMTSTALDGLTKIGVDETSYQKGHKYITVVVNHETKQIVWAEKGHGYKVFSKFFQQLTKEQLASIQYVSGDGARWIDQCVKEYVPHAKRAVDPFHVVLWFSEVMDKLRIYESRMLKKDGYSEEAKIVKSSTYALGKSKDDCNEKQSYALNIIKKHCSVLYRLYDVKEFIRKIIKEKDIDNLERDVKKAIFRLSHSKNNFIKELGRKLKRHTENFINAIKYNLSNARLEASNNILKQLMRKAFGYRNIKNLIQHILFNCSCKKEILIKAWQ